MSSPHTGTMTHGTAAIPSDRQEGDALESREAILYHLGRLPFESAWQLQQDWVKARGEGRRPDSLVLLEHDPVFTVGRSGVAAHWEAGIESMRASGIGLHHIDRGGSVTYHGPGQLMGYPIMQLRPPYGGPRNFVYLLEECLIRLLYEWGLVGERRERLHGVWVRNQGWQKIAAVGLRIVRGITMHGFALNVCPDLLPFRWIVPCGIDHCRVTSMAALLGAPVSVDTVGARAAAHFSSVFGLRWASVQNFDTQAHGSAGEEVLPHVE